MHDRLFPDIPTGATISEIAPLPSDPNMRRIRVGRRTVARLRASEIERLGLAAGQPWTEQRAAQVRHAIDLARARKHAFSALGRRGSSQRELIDRLMRKGHDAAIAEQIADELIDDGWLDDAALAREIVAQQRERKPAAPRLLREKLRRRGIADDVAERVIGEEFSGENEIDAAMDLAEKRHQSMLSLPSPAAARRLAGLLHRRGFDEETIETVLNRLGLGEVS